MSSRNCPTERAWLPVDKAWNSGTCKMGASNKRLTDPIAEKPNPESPLITPERKTITSMLASWRMLNPATAFGIVGKETIRVPVTTTAVTANSHSLVLPDLPGENPGKVLTNSSGDCCRAKPAATRALSD
jgi:hypothetical protein